MPKITFPSPLEVDRFISKLTVATVAGASAFPSPREVNRFISAKPSFTKSKAYGVSVPSRGR